MVVPKGANRGLNGNSVQPTATARNGRFGASPECELAAILWPFHHLDFHFRKSTTLCIYEDEPSPMAVSDIDSLGCNFDLAKS
jgi:hypothetical protein